MRERKKKQRVHLVPAYLLNPTNPIRIHLIGAGGTGSTFLTALARMNHALREMNHCGLEVVLFDHDIIEPSNLGRQLFAKAELGLNKAVALINRTNRFFGTNWKAVDGRYEESSLKHGGLATITVTCVDTVKSREAVADRLKEKEEWRFQRDRPLYWLDLGNGRDSGQVLLSTTCKVEQPTSKKFQTVDRLADVFETFPNLLDAFKDNDEPSCSLAQALNEQDLFINSVLSNMGASLLWSMFRLGVLEHRGFFLNLASYRSTPIPI